MFKVISHTDCTEYTEMQVLSTLITLALESTELHQLHGAPCGMLKINQHEDTETRRIRDFDRFVIFGIKQTRLFSS